MLKATLLIVTVITAFATKVDSANYDEYDDDITCNPSIADTCFTDVSKDLRWILQPQDGFRQTHNLSTLADLCSAWNDSISCTADIIDSDCSEADYGRATFDRWNRAFYKGFVWMCQDNLAHIEEIFNTVHCFNLENFMECIEKTAKLTSIQDLMKTKLDFAECAYLQTVLEHCSSYSSIDFEHEGNDVNFEKLCDNFQKPFKDLLNVIIQAAQCERPAKPLDSGTTALNLASEARISIAAMLIIKFNFL